jgi:hypothetical protein
MQKIKIINEIRELSKNEVLVRQDFGKVLKQYNKFYKPAVFKSPWFYGIVGLSSLLIMILVK